MKSPSKLELGTTPLFLDTSVLINLLASEQIRAIAKALGRRLVVEETVAGELKHHPGTKEDGRAIIRRLSADGVIEIARMTDTQQDDFMALVGAPAPDDLDDGEAATIAAAVNVGVAVIDESKGRRIASRDHAALVLLSTLDILCCTEVLNHVDHDTLRAAVRRAREVGRMRVPLEWKQWCEDFVNGGAFRSLASKPS